MNIQASPKILMFQRQIGNQIRAAHFQLRKVYFTEYYGRVHGNYILRSGGLFWGK